MKYKKLKQIKGSWNAWDIFTGLDPRLLHVPKWCPHQRNWGRHCFARFLKDNMNLRHWMYLFESAFEDLSFHTFLKTSVWDFEEKNGCSKHRIIMVDIVLILIVLKAQTPSGNCWKYHFQASKFQILWGSSRLRCSKCRLPPTFPVGMSTSKLIDSTAMWLFSKFTLAGH